MQHIKYIGCNFDENGFWLKFLNIKVANILGFTMWKIQEALKVSIRKKPKKSIRINQHNKNNIFFLIHSYLIVGVYFFWRDFKMAQMKLKTGNNKYE